MGYDEVGRIWGDAFFAHRISDGLNDGDWGNARHKQSLFCHIPGVFLNSELFKRCLEYRLADLMITSIRNMTFPINVGHVRCNRSKASCRKASLCSEHDYHRVTSGPSSKFIDWTVKGQLRPHAPTSCNRCSCRYNYRIPHWVALRCLVLE